MTLCVHRDKLWFKLNLPQPPHLGETTQCLLSMANGYKTLWGRQGGRFKVTTYCVITESSLLDIEPSPRGLNLASNSSVKRFYVGGSGISSDGHRILEVMNFKQNVSGLPAYPFLPHRTPLSISNSHIFLWFRPLSSSFYPTTVYCSHAHISPQADAFLNSYTIQASSSPTERQVVNFKISISYQQR